MAAVVEHGGTGGLVVADAGLDAGGGEVGVEILSIRQDAVVLKEAHDDTAVFASRCANSPTGVHTESKSGPHVGRSLTCHQKTLLVPR